MRIGIVGHKNSDCEKVAKELCVLNRFKDVKLVKIIDSNMLVDFIDDGFLEYGVMPISNNISGDITGCVESLSRGDVEIISAKPFMCHNFLFTKDYIEMEKINKIYATEQAFLECSQFISKLKGVELIKINDCYANVKYLKQNVYDDYSAVICDFNLGYKFDLFVKRKNIDNANSETTYVLLKKKKY